MGQVTRIIDANANRAREAFRVMEEAARFVLGDARLSSDLKQSRHELAAALARFTNLEAARDTPDDVGTSITAAGEGQRESLADIAAAAGKRLSEALRAMEEYGKLVDADFAKRIESLRYRGYDIEHRMGLALASTARRQWRVCVLLSEHLCTHHHWLDVAKACIGNGADCLQLREKHLEANDLLQRARKLVELARPQGISVIVNDRPDVAFASGADGVHLGQHDLPCREVRKIVGRQLLVGVSTSRLEQAQQAQRDGADYCGVGPMFNTTTKDKKHIVGPEYLSHYLQWNQIPHLAIGGVSPENISQLVDVGVRGVAVSGCVCASEHPERIVRELADALSDKSEQSPIGC